ncbi:MAG: ribosome hibernation-promoting factor, HPF/YfiA family [Christensenellales bacterium]|jgi:putative sigma-54 modulation protein
MRIIITGKNIEVSDYLRDIIDKKLKKLERFLKPETDVLVTLSIQRSRQIVEVTIPFDGMTIRGEESTGDMYASIDNVVDKLEKQITKHRTRLAKRLREDSFDAADLPEEDMDLGKVVRRKLFPAKPMTLDEAMMQIELLGHSFFAFANADTGHINVIYKRKDGDYGLLEPDIR